MDTTKQNILMCQKAIEIQKEWKPKAGDFYYWQNDKDKTANCGVVTFTHIILAKKANIKIYLPRQDQLQEILGYITITGMLNQVWAYNRQNNFISMEQLLLALVMKEKYNKVWNGKDWEKK